MPRSSNIPMNSLRAHFRSRKPPSTNTDAAPLRSPTSFHPPRLGGIVFQYGRLCPLNIAEIDAAFRPQSLPVSAGFNSPPNKPLFIHPAFHAHVFIFQGLLRADSGIPHGKTSPLYLPVSGKKRDCLQNKQKGRMKIIPEACVYAGGRIATRQ